VVTLLAVAAPVVKLMALVVSALNGPVETLLHFRSPAGLVARAGAPGDVFVAVQNVAPERMLRVNAAFALTVRVGPVVELKPASKSAGVGGVSAVDAGFICSKTTRPAVIETVPVLLQVPGAPFAVHGVVCAAAGGARAEMIIAATAARKVLRIISPFRP
jgi:hypothetical protein